MKIKTKLLTMISLMALTAVMLVVGVWALKTVNFTIDGNLSYIAPGIEATISKGTVTNAVWVNASDASTKMPLTQITRTDTEETLTAKFSYWQGVNLNFNEAGDDIEITFSITNNSSSKSIDISVSTSYTSADNCTISVDTTSTRIDAGKSHTFTLTMAVTDKTANATMTNFAVVFNMQLVQPTKAEDVSYLTFSYDDTTMEAKLTGYDGTTADVVIPEQIIYNNNSYKVTSITKSYYNGDEFVGVFASNKNLKTISWPSTITSIGEFEFQGCTSLTSISIPDSVTSIGAEAFTNCTKLIYNTYDNAKYLGNSINKYVVLVSALSTDIASCIINNDCRVICYSAFYNCTSLESVTIGSGVTSIGQSAFYGCTSLATVEVKATTVPTGGYNMFYNCPLTTGILVPRASVEAYKSATYWSNYSSKIQAGNF